MRNLIITLLSVLALSITFTGCGDSAGSVSAGTESVSGTENAVEEVVVDNGDVSETTITNEFGLNSTLGTPPPLPAS